METFRSLFYTPIYVALSRGFLRQEHLEVEFSTCPPGYHGISALTGGIAEITQTGPMRSILAADAGEDDVPPHFIEINSRDGFFLLGREPQDRFQWTDLIGATLIPVGFSPMPKASLKYALKLRGVDLADVHLIDGLSLQDAIDTFRRGQADFIHLTQPSVEEMVQGSEGYLAAALGPVTGHISYSSFTATQRFLDSRTELVQRFTQGFYNAQKWLSASDASAVADTVAPFFPEVAPSAVLGAIERYKQQGIWATDPLLREDGYNTLQDILIEAGLARSRQPYERIVRTDFAEKAMAQETGG